MPFAVVGHELRELREKVGKGLRELARELGIAHSILADIEGGRRFLAPHAEQLAARLGEEVFDVAELEDWLRAQRLEFEAKVRGAILLVKGRAKTVGGWTEALPEGTTWADELLKQHLTIDWDSTLTVAAVVTEMKLGREVSAEEQREVEVEVEKARAVQKRRQKTLREKTGR